MSKVPIDSLWVTSYSTSIDPTSYLSPFLNYLTSNFDDLEVGQFKVIQCQRLWCQSIVCGQLPIWP